MSSSTKLTTPPRSSSSIHSNSHTQSSGPLSINAQHGRRGSSSSLSVLSVSVKDPYFRDLQILQTDHAALYTQLKLTQQTLQHSYQDLVMAQERSKRAETDSGRLRNQMDNIMKKHMDHHPERETLVQELGDLQNRYEIEIGARRALEKEHSFLQHELLQYRLSHGGDGQQNSRVLMPPPPPASPASSFSGGGGPSPTSSIRSSTFSFLSGSSSGRRKNRPSLNLGNNNNERAPSVKSMRMTETEEILLSSPSTLPPLPQTPSTPSTPSRGWTAAHMMTPLRDGTGNSASSMYGDGSGMQIVQDPDHENLLRIQTQLPSWEQLETDKILYDQLREENVSMRMELNDLRHRNQAEKNSIKSYMSLFESLQKKQANALTVAQAEIDLLRSSLQEHILRLDSRETLIQTFAATVNSQAIELESLTKKSARDTASRAQLEQEMASLLEAALLILERLFSNVERTRSRIGECLDPVRQTIQHLEVPSILQEWETSEQGVRLVMNDLARSLIRRQELQESELTTGTVPSLSPSDRMMMALPSPTSSTFGETMGWKGQNQGRRGSNLSTASNSSQQSHIGSSTRPAHLTLNTTLGKDNSESDLLVLDNAASQEVFVWRKFMADSFLEDCVKSVESLATEKRELQTKIVELTRTVVDQEERRRLEEVHAKKNKNRNKEIETEKEKADSSHQDAAVATEEHVVVTNNPIPESDIDQEQEVEKIEAKEINDDLRSRTERLESILKKVLEWTEAQTAASSSTPTKERLTDKVVDAKISAETRNIEDDILALGISSPLTVMRAEFSLTNSTPNTNTRDQVLADALPGVVTSSSIPLGSTSDNSGNLRTLVEMIRFELSKPAPPGQVTDQVQKHQPPQVISTLQQSSSFPFSATAAGLVSPSYSSASSSSSSSAYSTSASGYFFASTTTTTTTTATTSTLGRLWYSTPLVSPGFSPTGEITDMDALCRDLAFRNFPRQHQWSKRRSSRDLTGSSAGSTMLPLDPATTTSSAAATFAQTSSSFTLPPRPPQPLGPLST
ncbi:hypothetical protein BGZ83_003678 [Gryganskiella cystojenkinii]|nr:hypothetical protein BGZ83_003678 [Gryganskiella cystojenkinii]